MDGLKKEIQNAINFYGNCDYSNYLKKISMNEIFKKKIFKYLPIVLIFLLAFILRFYNLNGEDFWTDEMFAYWTKIQIFHLKKLL